MATKVARGKLLLAKLRADPEVRNAESLAAWIGRRKRYKKAGLSSKEAGSLAGKKGGAELARMVGDLPGVKRRRKNRSGDRRKVTASKRDVGDPFNEDYGPNERKSAEDRRRERQEAQVIQRLEREERSKLHTIIRDAGGIQTRDDLREEYREIPNTFKRRDGMPGDEMAEYLSMYYPELGIDSENDLLDFFAA